MKTTFKRTQTAPRKVTLGRESVTVYGRTLPNGSIGYQVANYSQRDENGKRKRRLDSYATEADAIEAAQKLVKQMSQLDVIGAGMTRQQSIEYASAIPREVGGGKPEKAYVIISPENMDVANIIDLPSPFPQSSTNSLRGPIAIFLKTDTELLFVNYCDYMDSDAITNSEFALSEPKPTFIPSLKSIRADLVDSIVFSR